MNAAIQRLSRILGLCAVLAGATAWTDVAACPASLDFSKRYLNQESSVRLCEAFRDKVVLIVNTASKCAFTPQYDGLEALYDKYRERGLVVLGFPSNDFGGQEPGTEAEIQDFCRLTYSVRFPMFEKSTVSEQNAEPLFRKLAELGGGYPQWNFHKYLLDRQGNVVASFPSRTRPDDPRLVARIEELL
jgi:glutathione peroxidase